MSDEQKALVWKVVTSIIAGLALLLTIANVIVGSTKAATETTTKVHGIDKRVSTLEELVARDHDNLVEIRASLKRIEITLEKK